MYLKDMLNPAGSRPSADAALAEFLKTFPEYSVSVQVDAFLIGQKIFLITMGDHSRGEYFYLQGFPLNCGWLMISSLGGEQGMFLKTLEVSEWFAKAFQISAIIFSLNQYQKDAFIIPKEYKRVFKNKNVKSGHNLYMYIKNT